MVAFNPSERPSIEDILNNEWLKEINNLTQEEENKLEKEVFDYLDEISNKIREINSGITISEKRIKKDIILEVVMIQRLILMKILYQKKFLRIQ